MNINKSDFNASAGNQAINVVVLSRDSDCAASMVEPTPDLATGDSVFWNLVARIKSAIDPKNILSPGRYNPLRGDPIERD